MFLIIVLTQNATKKDAEKLTLLAGALAQQIQYAWNDFFLVPATTYLAIPDLRPATLYSVALKSPQYAYVLANYNAALALPATVSKSAETKVAEITSYAAQIQTFVSAKVSTSSTFLLPYVNQATSFILPYMPASVLKALEQYAPLLKSKTA